MRKLGFVSQNEISCLSRERDALLLSLWQKHKGDVDSSCEEASNELKIDKKLALERLDFLKSFL